MRYPNPFKPTAGASPPVVIGRETILDEFAEALEDGPGAPGRLSMVTGARGVGKTVLLTEAADLARERGWLALDETATPGLLDRLTHATGRLLRDHSPTVRRGRSVTSVALPVVGGGLGLSPRPAEVTSWREDLNDLLDLLEARETGLLITIDEVHAAAREDLRDLAATYQHLVREDRNVALVMAGLPTAVSDLLNDDVLTFLRRASRVTLGDVDLAAVRESFELVAREHHRWFTPAALDEAAAATEGYPFMVQLVGYQTWRLAGGREIDLPATQAGVKVARERLRTTVLATAVADLSEVDRAYLAAMAVDEEESMTSAVAERMGVDKRYGGTYRARLIAAGVIVPAGRGKVTFALPALREYVRETLPRPDA